MLNVRKYNNLFFIPFIAKSYARANEEISGGEW